MLLNSTKCVCGCDLKLKKFENYKPRKMDDKFYGGRVTMEAEIECECGRKYKGYFSNKSNGLGVELIDLELTRDITQEEKIDSEPSSTVVLTDPEEPYDPKPTVKAEVEDTKASKFLLFPDDENVPNIEEMTYKELQAYSKRQGIAKVNISKEKLLEQLKSL